MIGQEVSLYRRDLQFKFPAKTSRGTYLERPSWYIVYRPTEIDKSFMGEVSPLVDLSPEYIAQRDNFDAVVKYIAQLLVEEDLQTVISSCHFSSIKFALESISQAIAIYQGKLSLSIDKGIETNGLVWMGDKDEMMSRLKMKLHEGYKCIKFKIGAIDFDSELDLIKSVRKEYSPEEITIRLDANGAFKTYDEAMQKIDRLSRFDIHSLEQPVRQGQFALMSRIISNSPIEIGLDEELIDILPKDRERLIDELKPDYLVIKPTLHGGLSGAEDWANLILNRGGNYWITSALEGNIGLQSIAIWCLSHYDNVNLAYGLGTGDLFTNNLPHQHQITSGILHLKSCNQIAVDKLISDSIRIL